MGNIKGTPFSIIYDSFLARVEDSMYMELTELDTIEMLQDLLINAIPRFEFPRFDPFDYEEGYFEYMGDYEGVESNGVRVPATGWVGGSFNTTLTKEEINILSLCMVVEWLGQQLNTTENTRMKFSGSDFKFTSQANHMAKLKVLIDAHKTDCFHLQRLYKRRKVVDGEVQSTAGIIVTTPKYGFNII
ncbi:MAG: hypothetical protein IJ880_16855 [Bacilli bacterium]|nr:hypothetical protein [Bacilli bacterium]